MDIVSQIMEIKQPKQGRNPPVCREWPTGTDEAGRKGKEMKKEVIEFLKDFAAGICIFGLLVSLYILMAAFG